MHTQSRYCLNVNEEIYVSATHVQLSFLYVAAVNTMRSKYGRV
jgi:hypothetical protein